MKSKLFNSKPWRLWKPAWNIRNRNLLFTSYIGVFFLLFMGISYGLINRFSSELGRTAFDPQLSFDDAIPYIAILNLAYFSFYSYYVLIPFFANNEMQQKCAIVFSQQLFVATIPAFFIFLLFPVEVDLRSDVVGDDVLTYLLTLIHNVDQAYNAWPSLHVAHSLCVVLSVPIIVQTNRVYLALLWFGWILLTVSAMTTQQHYLFDVITGIVYGLFVHSLLIRPAITKCLRNEFDQTFEEFHVEPKLPEVK
ncbi:MAG: hypothetical protein CMA67_05945 [Euryarchaeota archaeon]|nr:hypothetical protein [Euryarchaeota archaeon]